MVRSGKRVAFDIFAFIILTLLTQVGGVAFLLSRVFLPTRAGRMPPLLRSGITLILFVVIYVALTWFIVPSLAVLGGRVPLPCRAATDRPFGAGHPLYCALNRNYVDARLVPVLAQMSRYVANQYPGTTTLYLDANFPLLNGFPLLPHLSHNDGQKLDLAFYYAARDGTYLPGVMRSPIGYWAFERPRVGDPLPCTRNVWLSLRWDLEFLQGFYPDRQIEPDRMRAALAWLVNEGTRLGVERVFIEPHLAKRLEVVSPLIGFQGCRAARHDDHIHFQIGK